MSTAQISSDIESVINDLAYLQKRIVNKKINLVNYFCIDMVVLVLTFINITLIHSYILQDYNFNNAEKIENINKLKILKLFLFIMHEVILIALSTNIFLTNTNIFPKQVVCGRDIDLILQIINMSLYPCDLIVLFKLTDIIIINNISDLYLLHSCDVLLLCNLVGYTFLTLCYFQIVINIICDYYNMPDFLKHEQHKGIEILYNVRREYEITNRRHLSLRENTLELLNEYALTSTDNNRIIADYCSYMLHTYIDMYNNIEADTDAVAIHEADEINEENNINDDEPDNTDMLIVDRYILMNQYLNNLITFGSGKYNKHLNKVVKIHIKKDDNICSICHEKYKNNQLICVLTCEHHYHTECISKWVHRKNNCPLCKTDII